MLRRLLFWSHLSFGILAGVMIFIMSATGAFLTFERQILEWDETRFTSSSEGQQDRISTDTALSLVQRIHPDEHHFFIRQVNREGAAIPVWAGHHGYLLDAYTGEILRTGQGAIGDVFSWVTALHRRLALEGEAGSVGKSVMAYSNLAFLFLLVTGAYLWAPNKWKSRAFKFRMTFHNRKQTSHARNLNWHHVFGFWALVPLIVIAATATLFHFSWANSALYGLYDESVPKRQQHAESDSPIRGMLDYETLFEIARTHARDNGSSDWYSMWIEIGEEAGKVRFFVDRSIGHQHALAYSLYLDIDTGEALQVKRQQDWSRGDQAWDIARFLHTGEHFGVIGQLVAGLASLAACFLVYTGLALSWRRYVTPLLLKRR